ncbi:MAG: hypothetical protein K7J46_21145 [Bryobacter sp.]|jgi:hypothetical protein|nr:hypothetical protein [Bryobacter sp. CoA8 C33]
MDLRLIIGRMLLAIGLLLVAATKLAPQTVRTQLYGMNLNFAWGVLLVVAGTLFLFTARRK